VIKSTFWQHLCCQPQTCPGVCQLLQRCCGTGCPPSHLAHTSNHRPEEETPTGINYRWCMWSNKNTFCQWLTHRNMSRWPYI